MKDCFKKPFTFCAIAIFCMVFAGLQGCGDSGPSPQPNIEADRLKVATELRSYFDKAHGDYSALSGADKAAFAKLAGGDSKAEAVFNAMKTAPRAGATTPPPTAGTGGQ